MMGYVGSLGSVCYVLVRRHEGPGPPRRIAGLVRECHGPRLGMAGLCVSSLSVKIVECMAQVRRGGDRKRNGVVATLEMSGGSIVVLGNFSPLTFLPDWFAQRGI